MLTFGNKSRDTVRKKRIESIVSLLITSKMYRIIEVFKTLARRHLASAASFVWRIVILVQIGLGTIGSSGYCQMSDSFEAGDVRWLLVEDDCQASIAQHEITRAMPHAGQSCERIDLVAARGTFAYLAYPIEPCAVIDEFSPSLWIRCASGPLQIGARVVFPLATNSVTGGRITTILWGDSYSVPGQWQRLELRESHRKFELEKIALRNQHGSDINLDRAYIDSIVVNAYTGPARSRIQVDDLNLAGVVSLANLGQTVAPGWRERWRWRAELPSPEQTQWAKAISNRPPLFYQYRGESLRWLHSLGFRGLLLDRIPSKQFLDEASNVGLEIICPPPQLAVAADDRPWNIVKGWMVGEALDVQQAGRLISQVERLVELPDPLKRPMLSEAMENFWMFSRITDEVVVPVPSSISAGEPEAKLNWLNQSIEISRKRGSGWVTISLDDPNWKKQLDIAREITEPDKVSLLTPTDPLQMRLQFARALSGQAKAFVLRTSQPLEPNADVDRPRIAALRTINRELTLLGPWIVAGQPVTSVATNRADYRASAWATSRSHMVLVHTIAPDSSYCVPPTADTPLECRLPIPFGTAQVVRLTSGSMEVLPLSPTPEGLTWNVRHPAAIEFFVLTDNPVVNSFLRRQLLHSVEAAEDHLNIASHMLNLAAATSQSRWQGSAEPAARNDMRMLASGQRRLEAGFEALRLSQSAPAVAAALESSHAAQAILTSAYRAMRAEFASPQTTPLALNPNGLRYHWLVAQACQRSVWRPLPLPGADFGNLSAMQQAGWSQDRRPQEQAELLVELLPQDSRLGSLASSGQSPADKAEAPRVGLRMAATRRSVEPIAGGYEGAIVRIRSSSAPVTRGQLVRVDGVAEIRRSSDQFGAGLLVYDNQAGPSLGQLIQGQPGQQVPIQLYRFVTDDGEFRVLAELRGECDIVVRSLSLNVIDPATNRSEFITTPYSNTTRTAGSVPADR